jgi:predicted dehydrogenase
MDRRSFLKAGTAGLVSSVFLRSGFSQAAALNKEVRIAFIGTGSRGRSLLGTMMNIPGWTCPALCDINEANLTKATQMVESRKGNKPEGYSRDEEDYKRMVARDDIDAILIATPAPMHARMSVDCMLAGKHVGSEVPAAYTIEECWDLVNLKEKTGLHFMLLENYTYRRANMMVMNMLKQNIFGETYFAEGSYIHDCRSLRFDSRGELTWRGEMKRDRVGSLYPTHAVGPVAKWMNINRGDVFKRMTSYMSKPASLQVYAAKKFGQNSEQAKVRYKAGDMCVTQIQTCNDCLITIQYDTDSSRPENCFYLIQGTEGIFDVRKGIYLEGKSKKEVWDPISDYYADYDHPIWKKDGKQAEKTGHGGGDYFVVREFIESLIEDREPWIDVYDAAAWSAIVELSQQSISQNNASVEFPDFTRGKWKERA